MEPTAQPIDNPYELADALEARGLLNPHDVRTFCCACCRLIWEQIPATGQEALGDAEGYLHHQIADDQLVTTRVNLWKFLGRESCIFTSPIVNAIRAVICCLYSDTSMRETDHLYDTVTATMDFCNAIIPHQREQLQLLQHIFLMPQ